MGFWTGWNSAELLISASPGDELVAENSRREAEGALEVRGEMALVVKADAISDIGHGVDRGHEQLLGLGKA